MGWMQGLTLTNIIFALSGIVMTALCWGSYGALLHEGQGQLGNERLKPLICVGLAYLVVGVILPAAYLFTQGQLFTTWTMGGFVWSFAAGTAGTIGALGISIAMANGGKPQVVMPLVFGGAPLVITIISMTRYKLWGEASPVFFAGVILVIAGAVTVLLFAPAPKKGPSVNAKQAKTLGAPAIVPGAETSTDTKT